MVLRAEDGTPLEVKQGIVLGRENSVHEERAPDGQQFKTFSKTFSAQIPRTGMMGTGLALVFIPLALAAGLAVVSIAIVIFAIFMILKLFSSVFSKSK
jgi:hypothetical protein